MRSGLGVRKTRLFTEVREGNEESGIEHAPRCQATGSLVAQPEFTFVTFVAFLFQPGVICIPAACNPTRSPASVRL
jgi:hypothetical protein